MNQEEMLDRLGIERLVYQYANAVDELDRQAFADCFAEGAVIVSPGVTLEGDFAGTVMDVLEKHYVYTMHNVQNRRYTVQDDRSECTASFSIFRSLGIYGALRASAAMPPGALRLNAA